MSEHEADSATVERDLAVIDEALATGAVSADLESIEGELQELALALRADTPAPDAGFAEDLKGRVDAGFPRARRRLVPRFAFSPLPVAGALAAVLVALVVIVSDGSKEDSPDGGGGGAQAELAAPQAGADSDGMQLEGSGGSVAESRARGGAADSVTAQPLPVPPGGGFEPGRRDRRIERAISLELEMPVEEMARVADGVTTVTNRHGGFVLSSSVSTGEDGSGGDFELRIPAERLRPALRDLSELATVRSQSQSGQDVTRDFVTAKDRLQAARAERRSLLRRLENADTDEEAEAIRARLDLVAGEINGLRGQLRDLRLRTDYAVVSVSLVADGNGGDEEGGGAGSFDDALGDAGDLLVGFAGVLVRVLALALPIGLIALAAWLVTSAARRRRRESALA
jgi:hypothetical protein